MINGVAAQLVPDVGDQGLSLLLNESAKCQYPGVVKRYFSDTKHTIVSTFLGPVELEPGYARYRA